MESIEILFKEYDTLRSEILGSMTIRNTLLSFGLTGVGAIATASIGLHALSPVASGTVLGGVIPALCAAVLSMWLGEYQRTQRAGRFLVDLEKRINVLASADLLSWETHLRKDKKHMNYPYNSTVLLLTGIGGVSMVIGIVMIDIDRATMAFAALAAVVLHSLAYGNAVRQMASLRG